MALSLKNSPDVVTMIAISIEFHFLEIHSTSCSSHILAQESYWQTCTIKNDGLNNCTQAFWIVVAPTHLIDNPSSAHTTTALCSQNLSNKTKNLLCTRAKAVARPTAVCRQLFTTCAKFSHMCNGSLRLRGENCIGYLSMSARKPRYSYWNMAKSCAVSSWLRVTWWWFGCSVKLTFPSFFL
jgi:hypothetical protein